MQGLSAFKFGERRDDWRCCLCCHVRTATIFLGVWHLMLQVLTLSIVAVAIRHPELMEKNQMGADGLPVHVGNAGGNLQISSNALPTPQSTSDDNGSYFVIDRSDAGPHRYNDYIEHMNVSVVVMFATFTIILLMLYGAIKGKPSYLMPFFCLQLFDFCITSLTALSYLCYLPDMHRLVAESPKIPMQTELIKLSPEVLAFAVLVTFTTAMIVKAYFIGVVWSCYKYLTLRLIAATRTLHFIQEVPTQPDLQDLLPDYETACSKYPQPSSTAAGQSAAASGPSSSLSPPPPPPPPPSYSQAVLGPNPYQPVYPFTNIPTTATTTTITETPVPAAPSAAPPKYT